MQTEKPHKSYLHRNWKSISRAMPMPDTCRCFHVKVKQQGEILYIPYRKA